MILFVIFFCNNNIFYNIFCNTNFSDNIFYKGDIVKKRDNIKHNAFKKIEFNKTYIINYII